MGYHSKEVDEHESSEGCSDLRGDGRLTYASQITVDNLGLSVELVAGIGLPALGREYATPI